MAARTRSAASPSKAATAVTDADLGFPHIRARVASAPYDAHARTQYRHS
jgi:hypothetical protein